MLHHFFVHNLVHDLKPLDSFLFCDSDELLLQRHWAEAVVEEVESLGGVYAEEGSHILIVGECGTEPHQSYIFLGGLYVSDGSVRKIGS